VVLEKSYLYGETPEAMLHRVAEAVSKPLEGLVTKDELEAIRFVFYNMMATQDFMPNTPTLTNAGRPLNQMAACFVVPVGDSMESIAQGIMDIGDAELLEEHKEGNVFRLENGQIAIYPNNRIKWLPMSLTKKEAAAAIPDWDVATNAQWDEWWADSDEILGDAKWAY
jgi:hypothetical protein